MYASPVTPTRAPLIEIETFGWQYDHTLSIDVNYLDLAYVIARGSISQKGQMGAVLIAGSDWKWSDILPAASYPPPILALANNHPIYPTPARARPQTPEIHAEASLICLAASKGVQTRGASVYITFPPCGACFSLLLAAGITRVVYRRRTPLEAVRIAATTFGVELVETEDRGEPSGAERMARVEAWWNKASAHKEETRARVDRCWQVVESRCREAAEQIKLVEEARKADLGQTEGSENVEQSSLLATGGIVTMDN